MTPNGSVTTPSLLFTLFLFLSHYYLLSFLITICIIVMLVRSSNFVKPVFPIPPYVLSFLFYFKLSFIHIHSLYLSNHTHILMFIHSHSMPPPPTKKKKKKKKKTLHRFCEKVILPDTCNACISCTL